MRDTSAELAHKITYKGEDFDKIKREFEEFIANKEKKEKLMVFDEWVGLLDILKIIIVNYI